MEDLSVNPSQLSNGSAGVTLENIDAQPSQVALENIDAQPSQVALENIDAQPSQVALENIDGEPTEEGVEEINSLIFQAEQHAATKGILQKMHDLKGDDRRRKQVLKVNSGPGTGKTTTCTKAALFLALRFAEEATENFENSDCYEDENGEIIVMTFAVQQKEEIEEKFKELKAFYIKAGLYTSEEMDEAINRIRVCTTHSFALDIFTNLGLNGNPGVGANKLVVIANNKVLDQKKPHLKKIIKFLKLEAHPAVREYKKTVPGRSTSQKAALTKMFIRNAATYAWNTLVSFCQDDTDSIMEYHVSDKACKWMSNTKFTKAEMVNLATSCWQELTRDWRSNQLPMIHDIYIKFVQIIAYEAVQLQKAGPLHLNFISYVGSGKFKWLLLDEAQDTNRCFACLLYSLLLLLVMLMVMFGDGNQEIYSWKGALELFRSNCRYEEFRDNHEKVIIANMLEVFRFSKNVANIANHVLKIKRDLHPEKQYRPLKSIAKHQTEVVAYTDGVSFAARLFEISKTDRIVFICRKNSTLVGTILSTLIDLAEEFKEKEITLRPNLIFIHASSVREKVKQMMVAVVKIMRRFNKLPASSDYGVSLFDDKISNVTPAIAEEAINDMQENSDWKFVLKLALVLHENPVLTLRMSNAEALLSILEMSDGENSKMQVANVHNVKGMSIEKVALADDFCELVRNNHLNKNISVEELNCLYVAVTRCKSLLLLNKGLSNYLRWKRAKERHEVEQRQTTILEHFSKRKRTVGNDDDDDDDNNK